jgi:hypothetical protein
VVVDTATVILLLKSPEFGEGFIKFLGTSFQVSKLLGDLDWGRRPLRIATTDVGISHVGCCLSLRARSGGKTFAVYPGEFVAPFGIRHFEYRLSRGHSVLLSHREVVWLVRRLEGRDARNGSLNAENQVGAMIAEVAVAELAFEEIAESACELA